MKHIKFFETNNNSKINYINNIVWDYDNDTISYTILSTGKEKESNIIMLSAINTDEITNILDKHPEIMYDRFEDYIVLSHVSNPFEGSFYFLNDDYYIIVMIEKNQEYYYLLDQANSLDTFLTLINKYDTSMKKFIDNNL